MELERNREMDRRPLEPGDHEQKQRLDVPAAVVGAALEDNYFELYRLAVEMADRISARRGVANSFFLTANTGVVGVLGAVDVRWYLAAAGMVFSVTWWALLKSYRDLNSAKFDVILAMEDRLPVRIYGDEWDRLRKESIPFGMRREALRSWLAQYRELGRIERVIPWIFTVLYSTEIVRQLVR